MVNTKKISVIEEGVQRMQDNVMRAGEGKRRINKGRRILALGLLIVCALVFSPSGVLAQGETTSAIVGEVTDATHATIPGATVTIVNAETGLERRARTDNEGRFNFPQLSPGSYTVKLEAQGFEPQQIDHVVAGLGQKQTVNFMLKVASMQQAIEVSGAAPLINTENANTSATLAAPALEDLAAREPPPPPRFRRHP